MWLIFFYIFRDAKEESLFLRFRTTVLNPPDDNYIESNVSSFVIHPEYNVTSFVSRCIKVLWNDTSPCSKINLSLGQWPCYYYLDGYNIRDPSSITRTSYVFKWILRWKRSHGNRMGSNSAGSSPSHVVGSSLKSFTTSKFDDHWW